jgi:beta-fructofuranosidase
MYQFHPQHVQWGNMSWGHAVSKDLVTWTDVGGWRNDEAVGLAPSEPYDHLSVFSGTMQPTNLTGGNDGTLLIFYTSISELPTSWSIPYIPGTESQSLATSIDGGRTWQKYEGNPVIEGSPEHWNITGHRDPFFELWPEMDALLGQEEEHWYMVLGSGIKGVGPRIPLYTAKRSDPTNWTFLGALWEPSMNETFGDVEVTGSYGYVIHCAHI